MEWNGIEESSHVVTLTHSVSINIFFYDSTALFFNPRPVHPSIQNEEKNLLNRLEKEQNQQLLTIISLLNSYYI